MFKPYSFFIGIRYAGAKRSSQLVSFISLVSMLGMTIGVALLILVLSVMNGFEREMHTRILGLVPHIKVSSYGAPSSEADQWPAITKKILQHPEVNAIAPFAELNAMLLRGTQVEGVLVYGIDPSQEKNVSIIDEYIDPEALKGLQTGSRAILLGEALANRLDLVVGDTVNLMVPKENARGSIQPSFSRLHVTAVFNTHTEIDQSVALIALDTALAMMPPDRRRQGFRISVNDTSQASRIAWELEQNIPYGYITRDWTRSHGNLYSAIQMSKELVGLMLLTIIAVAAFNVVSALVMIVTDKRGDIAILRTLGASSQGIMATFMMQGTLIALIGTALGTVIGVLLSLSITDMVAFVEELLAIQFLNSDVYPVDYLPSDLRWVDVARVCLTAFFMSIAATVYPAWRASRVQPADALRYE
ncbi:MAG: lipoprotein-releasing ABC transporter permease subunit [Spongiibacteraceae bacterium]|nr:lipoprotein-releasing ABC transporter permease subunit [Spongiibacteraceae bacterium]